MTEPLDLDPTTSAGPTDAPEPAEPAAPAPSETPQLPARTRFADPTPAPADPTPAPAGPLDPEPVAEPEAAVEAAPAPEPAPVPVALEPPEPVEHRGTGLVVTLAVVVALLAGLTGFLGWKVSDTSGPSAGQKARQPALQAVRSAAVLLFSYDYRHLAADFKAGRATTTGAFQGEYDKTTAKLVQDVAGRYKAVVIAAVSEASVVTATEDRVVTLVFLNQQSTSTLTSAPKVTQSRLLMTLVRKNGTWLVSEISPR